MAPGASDMTEYEAGYGPGIRTWERAVPWYRRLSARTGLQGKLVLSFMFLLVVALGASAWQFVNESREITARLVTSHAQTTSHALAMASETPLAQGDRAELDRIGKDLLHHPDIVGVSFYDPPG